MVSRFRFLVKHVGRVFQLVTAVVALAAAPDAGSAEAERGGLEAEVARLEELTRASRMPAALRKVDFIVGSPGFVDLQERQQYRVLVIGGSIAASRREYEKAHELFTRATGLSLADSSAFKARGDAARSVGKVFDAADSFMVAYERWPQQWTKRDEDLVLNTIRRMFASEGQEVQYEVLNRLYSANFKGIPDEEPSGLWQEFARLLIRNKENGRAAIVAGRVNHPHVLISMRADREFDGLREVNPALLDVAAAAENLVIQATRNAEEFPEQVVVQTAYVSALYIAGRYDEVVSAANRLIENAQSAEGRSKLDMPDEIAWILDYKSRALFALDRESEAIETLVSARQIPENGRENVSHAINLASAYCVAGQYRKALDTLDLLGSPSPYGRLQVMLVRHCAARGTDNRGEMERAFAYVEDNKEVSPLDYLEMLLLTDRIDDAATYLVGMLDGEAERTGALQRLQVFDLPAHLSESTRLIDARLAEIAVRPEVKAAIDKVGRVERFAVSRPLR